jgi:hypothetical protein
MIGWEIVNKKKEAGNRKEERAERQTGEVGSQRSEDRR